MKMGLPSRAMVLVRAEVGSRVLGGKGLRIRPTGAQGFGRLPRFCSMPTDPFPFRRPPSPPPVPSFRLATARQNLLRT